MSAPLLLGTASWTDKPLIDSGRFYPPRAKNAEARLRHYTTRYPLVEIDAPYYGLPTPEQAARWIERTPEGFTFDVKAYSLFTEHPTPVARLPKAIRAVLPPDLEAKGRFYRRDTPDEILDLCWSSYTDALLPLHDAGRLGAVVLQFPKWFVPGPRAFATLEETRDRLGPFRGAVEFRQRRWLEPEQREETLALLGDLDLSLICVDAPQGFDSSLPPFAAATNALAFVRFHGRNTETWERRTRTSSERFDYWYGEARTRRVGPAHRGAREGGGGGAPDRQHQQPRPGPGQRRPAAAAPRGARSRHRAGLRGGRGSAARRGGAAGLAALGWSSAGLG